MSRTMTIAAAVLAAAIAFLLGVALGRDARPSSVLTLTLVVPSRDALAAALFYVYGNVTRHGQSIGPDRPGPRIGHRPLEFWLEDSDAVIDYARRYPRG